MLSHRLSSSAYHAHVDAVVGEEPEWLLASSLAVCRHAPLKQAFHALPVVPAEDGTSKPGAHRWRCCARPCQDPRLVSCSIADCCTRAFPTSSLQPSCCYLSAVKAPMTPDRRRHTAGGMRARGHGQSQLLNCTSVVVDFMRSNMSHRNVACICPSKVRAGSVEIFGNAHHSPKPSLVHCGARCAWTRGLGPMLNAQVLSAHSSPTVDPCSLLTQVSPQRHLCASL